MRHGYEWWEAFWKWLLKQCLENDDRHSYLVLKDYYEEFEEKWRKGDIPRSKR
ncbi:MAG: hypothetical protein JRD89_01225 [Deltaproteobacteria bacterium]|nr:hypothetical protein [Deltaproteobacteria bacterium]